MPYDKTKFHRYQGEPLIPVWVMDEVRKDASATGSTLNRTIARWLSKYASVVVTGREINPPPPKRRKKSVPPAVPPVAAGG